jgi:8-oxo-dGTP pyrophosphatase MutT (NUDIX family)
MPGRIRHRAYAYITDGSRLLIFRHVDAPEAGLQVSAGTIEPGEEPADAAMREAREETGLRALTLVSFLGRDQRDMSDCGVDEGSAPVVLPPALRWLAAGDVAARGNCWRCP